MRVLRNVGLIVVGMVIAVGLLLGAGAVLADGPMGGFVGLGDHIGFMGGGHMHGGQHDVNDFLDLMSGRHQTRQMHDEVHDGEMPEACIEMMDDPEMMGHMMQMMHGDESMSLAECQAWMTEHEVPSEMQADCLQHMAEHHQP